MYEKIANLEKDLREQFFFKMERPNKPNKKIIEPFVELEIIPSNPYY